MNLRVKSLLLNLLLHALLFGLVWLLFITLFDRSSLTPLVLERYQTEPLRQDGYLALAIGKIVWWAAWSFLVAFLLSSFWIVVIAGRAKVTRRPEITAYLSGWGLCLILLLLIAIGIYLFDTAGVIANDLTPGTITTAGVVGTIGIVLAYWLGTGMFVKPVMQPAVPLGDQLPSLGGR